MTSPALGIVSRKASSLLLFGAFAIALAGCQNMREGMQTGMHKQRGYDALERGNFAAAEIELSKAVAADPADWRLQLEIGRLHLRNNRPLDAQLALEKALNLRPSSEESAVILDALAEALFRQRQDEELFALLKNGTQEYGTTHDYLRQGNYLTRIGDVDGASLAYRMAAKLGAGTDPRPYLAMADFYESIGDNQQAIINLRKAHGLAPTDQKIADRLRAQGVVPGPAAALPTP